MSEVLPTAKFTAVAATVWLLLASGPSAVAEEQALGRLFFTPERRQQLDYQREMNVLDEQQAPADPTLTIDGIVTRSSGRRTAWVNGQAQHEDDFWSGLTVTPRHGDPGTVLLEISDAPAAKARVGQTVNRNSGETTDLLNGGRVRVHSTSRGAR
ncbi:MAG: hypothetical protein AW10_00942 [Candidatus Accumulibacter appositus]|uniref:Uncharacterized protein n=1 Tax=Candidatus Accumulibacter appositus TaxID=1454003 RepID=A0A011P2N0_9PROT|nr:hypothetical protein [Accumulibacter sp.]EXI81861.1 MAG: hypothetical protein AW10_00942 [Candidatus Accumulibacter appositus]HRF04327.1 hypothetical protein [Accumulibacter sp.]